MINLQTTIRTLFVNKTNSFLIQFFRYVFVGGIAFLADWLTLYALVRIGLFYLIAAALAFLLGLGVNFFLSKMFIFTEASKVTTPLGEFIVYGVIGIVGLVLTELLMYLFTDRIGLYFMISKVFSAVIVLAWNFVARKITLYRT